MSSTIQKITDKLTGKNKEHDDPHSANYGPHSSAAANKADPRIDSDLDGRNNPTAHTGGYGHTQTAGIHSTTGNAIGDSHHTAGNPTYADNTHSTNTGPHNSNLVNKLDPRVDSDRDGRNDPTSHAGGYGGTQTAGTYGGNQTTGTYGGAGVGGTHQSTTAGPHSSNLANKFDPRVDSDLDGSSRLGSSNTGGHPNPHVAGTGTHQGTYTSTHTGTQGYAGGGNALGNTHSTNAGPHSNNLLNKLDPRVDSDRDGSNYSASHTTGYGHTQSSTGYTGSNTHGTGAGVGSQGYTGTNDAHDNPRSTNTGPHSSNLLNKLDPRVDSDHDGRNNPASKTGGYGQTQTGTEGVGRY